MWDHLPCDPNGIYKYARDHFNNAHGLTVVRQYHTHCDFFLFASSADNTLINNFYINHKEDILSCVYNFYIEMHQTLEELSSHRLWIPANKGTLPQCSSSPFLSRRQSECALLLLQGLTTKQIAQKINISPRMVEEHLMHLKQKLEAPNKTLLTLKLNNLSKKGDISFF